jgi:hypothetical protein
MACSQAQIKPTLLFTRRRYPTFSENLTTRYPTLKGGRNWIAQKSLSSSYPVARTARGPEWSAPCLWRVADIQVFRRALGHRVRTPGRVAIKSVYVYLETHFQNTNTLALVRRFSTRLGRREAPVAATGALLRPRWPFTKRSQGRLEPFWKVGRMHDFAQIGEWGSCSVVGAILGQIVHPEEPEPKSLKSAGRSVGA